MSLTRFLPILLAALVAAAPARAEPATSSIMVDPMTGFAIDGYDPVAYFAEARARDGRTRYETRWAGAVWLFASRGNRDAFDEAPAAYAPAFGGHCPVAVARGYAAQGDPLIWAVHEQRLYFFFSTVNRHIFIDDPGAFIAQAQANAATLFTW